MLCRMGKRKTTWHRGKKNESKVGSEGHLGMFLAEVEQVVLSHVSSLFCGLLGSMVSVFLLSMIFLHKL